MSVERNAGFLKECIRRIPLVNFVDRPGGTAYLRASDGTFEVLDPTRLAQVLDQPEIAAVLGEIAPQLVADQR